MLLQGLRSQASADVVVDASALTRFDSTALAVLLEFRRDCTAQGKRFQVLGLPTKLRELANLYGIAELLPAA
jgi:phospholipid transport system transporter-binding protein